MGMPNPWTWLVNPLSFSGTCKSLMETNRDCYIYGICSGVSENPLGFYFKWMGFSIEESLDDTLYKDSDWKIIWLSKKLSDSQFLILTSKRFLPGVTPPLKWPVPMTLSPEGISLGKPWSNRSVYMNYIHTPYCLVRPVTLSGRDKITLV